MTKIIIALLLSVAPNRPLAKDESRQAELAEAFEKAGEKHNVDPALLAVWAYHESSFRMDAKGALNEKGLFQVHGVAHRICRQLYDLDTLRGQSHCGALLINMGSRKCGSLTKGLWWYASGRCRGTPRAKRAVRFRLNRLNRLKDGLVVE